MYGRGGCTLRALWQTLEHWMRGTLNQITLADLVRSEGQIVELLRSRLANAVLDVPAELITLTPLRPALVAEAAGLAGAD